MRLPYYRAITYPDRKYHISRTLFYKGWYEPFETVLFEEQLQYGMTVIDAGANIGHYTLTAADLVGPKGAVYSFEPEPNTYQELLDNLSLNNFSNIHPYNSALGDIAGKATIYSDRDNLGWHSLAEANVSFRAGCHEIQVSRLDDLVRSEQLDRVDLIKMDTQGAEGLIISGAHDTLSTFRPVLFMEFWPWALRRLGTDPEHLLTNLIDLGYTMYEIQEESRHTKKVSSIKLMANQMNREWFVNLLLVTN